MSKLSSNNLILKSAGRTYTTSEFPTRRMKSCKVNFLPDASPKKVYALGTLKLKIEIPEVAKLHPSQLVENDLKKLIPGLARINLYSPVWVEVQRERGRGPPTYVAHSGRPDTDNEVYSREFIQFQTEDEINPKKYTDGSGLYYYHIKSIGFDAHSIQGLASQKVFQVDLADFNLRSLEMTLHVSLLEQGILGPHVYGGIPERRLKIVPRLLSNFIGVKPFDEFSAEPPKEDLNWFFSQVKAFHGQEHLAEPPAEIQHPALQPVLREYQKRAVHWMLYREGIVGYAKSQERQSLNELFLSKMYKQVTLTPRDNGPKVTVFYNRFVGAFSWQMPFIPPLGKVGILADEMGLGKTVEILTLILVNPRPTDQLKNWRDPNGVPNPYGKCEEDPDVVEDEEEEPLAKIPRRALGLNLSEAPPLVVKSKLVGIICPCSRDKPSKKKGKGNGNATDEVFLTCTVCKTLQHPDCVRYKKDWLNRRNGFTYTCPFCVNTSPPMLSKTTLIIVPDNLSHQWMEEVRRHIDTGIAKFLFYEGVKNKYIPPEELVEYDVIITSYGVLQSEVAYLDSTRDTGRVLRRAKRYPTIPSPLPHIEWWRICLDEAQTIQGVSSNMSKMAKVLLTSQRWCVTGTPMIKGVEDLFGQVAFLEICPIKEARWWKWLICEPYLRRDLSIFYDLFGQIIWRTEKKDIAAVDLNIPPQTSVNHFAEFSAVESYFYARENENSVAEIERQVATLVSTGKITLDTELQSMSNQTLTTLMAPFLRLRQACCHPHLLSNRKVALVNAYMREGREHDLEQVTTKLVAAKKKDVRLELVNLFELLIEAADLEKINGKLRDALQKYNKVSALYDAHENLFIKHPIELIRALKNIHGIYTSKPKLAPPDYHVGNQATRCQTLEEDYVAHERAQRLIEHKHWKGLHYNNEGLFLQQKRAPHDWLSSLVKCLSEAQMKTFVKAVKASTRITDVKKLEEVCASIGYFWRGIAKTLDGFGNKNLPSAAAGVKVCSPISKVWECEEEEECRRCDFKRLVARFSACLYGRQAPPRPPTAPEHENETPWEEKSERDQAKEIMAMELEFNDENEEEIPQGGLETCLTWILANVVNSIPPNLIIIVQEQLELLSQLKKEYLAIRSLLKEIDKEESRVLDLIGKQYIHGYAVKTKSRHSASRGNIGDKQKEDLDQKLSRKQTSLDKQIHFLRYLTFLREKWDEGNSQLKEEECIVCLESIEGMDIYFLACGHIFCADCTERLGQDPMTNFNCPNCRTVVSRHTAKLIQNHPKRKSAKKSSILGESSKATQKPLRPIVGNYSAKVDAIVRTILDIQETQPKEKILIFSSWTVFFTMLSPALRMNRINHEQYCNNKAGQRNLDNFKTSVDLNVLLMPLALGSRGLNITEATHVMLTDPILNKASEVQAIGRVHRIGQTKSTTVHRFFVKCTIEQHLSRVLSGKSDTPSSDEGGNLTIRELLAICNAEM